jgi:hypothetical protein
MNLSMVISVYASISRELGLPLRFPGTRNAYTALYQVTSADILARATEWAVTARFLDFKQQIGPKEKAQL